MPFIKKNKFIQVLCALLVLSFTHANANTPTTQSWYVSNIIAPVHLNPDTTILNLNDFFTEPSKIDSLVFSKGYKGHWNKKENTIRITSSSNMPPLAELRIWGEGKNTSVLLIKSAEKTTTNNAIKSPRLATLQSNKSSFTFSVENGVTDVFVYWQNARIKVNFTHVINQTVQVEIPEEARHKTRSFVRVFACNEAGVGNNLLIPLESGQVVTDYKSLNRYDLHTLSIYSILPDKFYKGSLTGVLEKLKAGYFDSLHINTLCFSPISLSHIDDGSGTDSILKNLISLQHRMPGNVLVNISSNPAVSDNLLQVDSALQWIQKFDVDGFEHNTVPYNNSNFYRTLTQNLKKIETHQHRPFYQFSKVVQKSEPNNYIGNGLLDGQTDFSLSDTAKACFAKDSAGLQSLATTLQQSLNTYGSHHLMANVTGGYGVPRFNVSTRSDTDYNKIANFIAFTATIPGIPVLYSGYEIGLQATISPTNQPVMRFETLSSKEYELKTKVAHLFQLRSQHMSLIYGDLNILQADQKSLVYQRSYFTESAIVIFNNAAQSKAVTVKISPSLNGRLVAQFGNKYSQKGDTLTIQLPPKSFEILIAPAY